MSVDLLHFTFLQKVATEEAAVLLERRAGFHVPFSTSGKPRSIPGGIQSPPKSILCLKVSLLTYESEINYSEKRKMKVRHSERDTEKKGVRWGGGAAASTYWQGE